MVASTLKVGDVAIIGYNTGQSEEVPATTDRIHFVLLAPIGSGTTIHFTDRSWNGTSFGAAGGGEGTFTYTAATDIPAGTVIEITQAQLTAAGITLSESGETIYAYQGADANTPSQFLFALEIADGNSTVNGSLVNTGLTAGYSAVSVAHDSAAYTGPTTHAESFLWNGSGSTLLHSISDASNWVGDDFAAFDNSKEQEVQTGSWLTHADVEFWGTMSGGGGGLVNTLRDATFGSGNDDFNHTRIWDAGSSSNSAHVGQFASLRDLVFDTVDGKFFLVDSDTVTGQNRILQGNIADLIANPTAMPALTVLYSDTGTSLNARLDNLEVDVANNIIYFTHGDELIKVGYDTANQAGTLLFRADVSSATSPSGVANPAGNSNNFFNDMVIDFDSGRIYISSTRVGASAGGDAVVKNFIYELSGLTTGSGTDAFQFAAGNTGTARLLPFVDNDDAYNPNAGTTASPANSQNQAYFWAVERGSIDGLALDPVNNILYFSTGEILFDHNEDTLNPIYQGGVIASYALNGNPTGATTILYQQTAQFGGAIPGLMGDLEIDTVNGHLYVLDTNGVNGVNDDNHWFRLDTSGGTPLQFTQTVGDREGAATVGLTLNHAPTLAGNALVGGVTEQSNGPGSAETSAVALFTGVTISDPDTTTADEISGAVVRISANFQSGATHQDYLRINGTLSGTIAGSGIAYTYNVNTGAMVLTGAGTVAEYQAAIQLVQFTTSGDDVTAYGTAPDRTIAVSVSDGLTMSDEITATVTVTGINDRPVNTVGVAMNFTEDTTGNIAPGTPVNAVTGISVSDVDADPATQDIVVTLSVNVGTLTIRTDVTNGLAAGEVVGNGTATLTLTGTQNQINATLAAVNGSTQANGLVFTAPANFNGAATLTIVTNDQGLNGNDPGQTGTGTSEEDSDTKALNVADVNDAPTVNGDGTEDVPAILEDTPLTDATAQTVASLFGGQFADAVDVQVSGSNPTGSAGDTFAGVAIVANGSSGTTGQWQYWNGASWVDIGTASQSAARTIDAATQIRFNPAQDYNGAAPTLTVHLIESGGSAIVNGATVNLDPAGSATGGTTVYSSSTVVLSQSITAVNDAPTATNLSGDAATWTEGDVAVLLDVGGNAALADVDSPDFDGGTLSVQITSGLEMGNDFLLIANQGTGAGQIGISGTDVTYGGVVIGTSNGDGGAGTILTVTFNANASLAAVQALARAMSFTNAGGDSPADGDRTVTWTLVDGDGTANGGSSTLSFTTTVDVDPVNDAPSGGDETVVVNEDDAHTFSAADFNFSDVDGGALLEVVITTLPGNGTLYLNGLAITVAGTTVSAADIGSGLLTFEPDPDENGTGYASFTFQVRDNGGMADGGQNTDQTPNTMTIDVTALNDAPVNTVGGTVNATEGDTNVVLSTTGAAMSVADIEATGVVSYTLAVSNGTLTIRTDVGGGITAGQIDATPGTGNGTSVIIIQATVAQINATLGASNGLLYTPDTNFSGDDTLEVYVNDIGQTGLDTDPTSILEAETPGIGALTEEDYDTRTITIAAVDDAPVAQPDAVGTAENVVLTGGVGSLFADNGSGVDADVDGPPLSIAEVNGSAANVGTPIVLASGALLTVGADGSYSYDPNGKFNYLISAATALSTGAVNDAATDSFTYRLAGGNTVTVTVEVSGIDGAGDQLRGDGNDNTINGTTAANLIHLGQGGEDTASGGAGDDGFYMGAELSALDVLDGGTGNNDQLGLQGNYGTFGGGGVPFVLGAGHLTGIEVLVLLSGNDTRFGAGGSELFSYNLASIDANVGAGQTFTVNFNTLRVGENATFDGSAESDGAFFFYGGLGTDDLTGGAGDDGFYFGNNGRFGAGDVVDGGAGNEDQLGLQGSYTLTFGAAQMSGIETLVLLTGGDNRFGNPAGTGYSYDLTMDDGNVAAGQTLVINANTLRADVPGVSDETLTFDGSAESDGQFTIYSGAGDDTIVGGSGNDRICGAGGVDTLTGGLGNDVFLWVNAGHSAAAAMDQVLDFTLSDLLDLSAIDADSTLGGSQDFAFVGAAAFGSVAGQLRAEDLGGGQWQVEADIDGNGVADFAFGVTVADAHAITAADFVLI